MKRRFAPAIWPKIGNLFYTQGISYDMASAGFAIFIAGCLGRYINGDWGDMDKFDKELNDRAVKTGDDRVLASYNIPESCKVEGETKVYLITEQNRRYTTILFSSEY